MGVEAATAAGAEGHATSKSLEHDVLIIGAGLSGIYSLYRMKKLGLRVRVLEAGTGEGGTWFWLVIESRG